MENLIRQKRLTSGEKEGSPRLVDFQAASWENVGYIWAARCGRNQDRAIRLLIPLSLTILFISFYFFILFKCANKLNNQSLKLIFWNERIGVAVHKYE